MVQNILVDFIFMNMKVSYPMTRKKLLLNHIAVSMIEYYNLTVTYFDLDYIEHIDEVRTGLNSRIFDRLFRHKMVEKTDVSHRILFSLFSNQRTT